MNPNAPIQFNFTTGLEVDTNPSFNFVPQKTKTSWEDIAGFNKPKDNADKTGDSMNGKYIVVNPGESIQKAIDLVYGSGGGIVALKNGTHTPGGNITVPSGIYVQGLNAQSCIINFGSASYGFIIAGSNNYTTGTCSVTKGSTTVTGGSTTWTSAMVGRSILLSGLWYPIVARVSNTEITLGANYCGPTLSGSSYTIATTVKDTKISDLTIQYSTSYGIKSQYVDWQKIINVYTVGCAVGVYFDTCSRTTLDIVDTILCNTSVQAINSHFAQFLACGSIGTASGNAYELTSCTNNSLFNCFVENSVGDGIQFTSCSDSLLTGCNFVGNGGQGYELISGNNNIFISNCGAISNASDGIKLTATSDGCVITNCVIKDNGGWGINIAASTCDNNTVKGNQYTNNTSGDITDSGTNTNGGSSEENRIVSVIASDTLRASADTERSLTGAGGSKTLVKEILVRYGGTIRVKFDSKAETNNGGIQVYKNGVAFGTSRTITAGAGYATYSEDLVFSANDLVQLYYDPSGGTIYAKNFRLYFTKAITTDTTVNTD